MEHVNVKIDFLKVLFFVFTAKELSNFLQDLQNLPSITFHKQILFHLLQALHQNHKLPARNVEMPGRFITISCTTGCQVIGEN